MCCNVWSLSEVRHSQADFESLRAFKPPLAKAYADNQEEKGDQKTPQKILNREILGRMNTTLRQHRLPVLEDSQADSAQKMVKKANQMLGQLNTAGQTKYGVNLSEVIADLHRALKDGMQSARDLLGNLGMLDEATLNDLNKAQTSFDEAEVLPKKQLTSTVGGVLQQHQAKQSTTVQIQTRDGDVVNIDIRRASTMSAMFLQNRASDENQSIMAQQQNTDQSLEFNIEGNLDQDEVNSIKNLLGKIGDLADKFFKDDLDQAFKQAMKLGFDSEEIAGFSLSLSSEETYHEALVSGIQTARQPRQTSNGALAALGDFVRSFIQTANSPAAEEFNKPQEQLADLLDASLQMHPKNKDLLPPQMTQRITEGLAKTAQHAASQKESTEDAEKQTRPTPPDVIPAEKDVVKNPMPQATDPSENKTKNKTGQFVLMAMSQFVEVRSMISRHVE